MIGFAVCGAGRIGALHASNIAAHARARLVTVYDLNPASAERVAAATGPDAAATAKAAIEDPEVDAVVIASSTNSHIELMMAAVRAGKAVFCEKPIDLDIARVNRCRNIIAGLKTPIQIGFNRRFDASHARPCPRSARGRCRPARTSPHHQPRSVTADRLADARRREPVPGDDDP